MSRLLWREERLFNTTYNGHLESSFIYLFTILVSQVANGKGSGAPPFFSYAHGESHGVIFVFYSTPR